MASPSQESPQRQMMQQMEEQQLRHMMQEQFQEYQQLQLRQQLSQMHEEQRLHEQQQLQARMDQQVHERQQQELLAQLQQLRREQQQQLEMQRKLQEQHQKQLRELQEHYSKQQQQQQQNSLSGPSQSLPSKIVEAPPGDSSSSNFRFQPSPRSTRDQFRSSQNTNETMLYAAAAAGSENRSPLALSRNPSSRPGAQLASSPPQPVTNSPGSNAIGASRPQSSPPGRLVVHPDGHSVGDVAQQRTVSNESGSREFENDDEEALSKASEQQQSFRSRLMADLGVEDDRLHLKEKEWTRRAWHKYSNEKAPNVFGNLYIAEDGGFSEVNELWYKSRWATAIIMIGFIMSNIYFIIYVDLSILRGKTESKTMGKFLLTQSLAQIFNPNIHQGDQLIAIFELLGLSFHLASLVHQAAYVIWSKSERARWFAVERIFWQIIPHLSSYSAMRLLHHVSPAVFLSSLSTFTLESSSWERFEFIKKLIKFVFFHLFCMLVGFDSFLVKIRAAYGAINDANLDPESLYGTLVFLVQVLGVVRLGSFVQQRLFVFIFAGEDSVMQPLEKAKQNVWQALLVREIWRSYSKPRFFVLMLSFDDTDFQKLVLNERGQDRARVCDTSGMGFRETLREWKATILRRHKKKDDSDESDTSEDNTSSEADASNTTSSQSGAWATFCHCCSRQNRQSR